MTLNQDNTMGVVNSKVINSRPRFRIGRHSGKYLALCAKRAPEKCQHFYRYKNRDALHLNVNMHNGGGGLRGEMGSSLCVLVCVITMCCERYNVVFYPVTHKASRISRI